MDIRNYEKISDEEIDLKKFFATLLETKFNFKVFISGFIIGLLIAFTSKVWQGGANCP